jgi:cell growth-regulating nucleolar protein
MVYFICSACQETLKKPAVEKHTWHCRSCWTLTCVDCSKEFHGQEYAAHLTCISEEEKYQGALYKPKGGKKGAKADPQEVWTEQIARAAATAPRFKELMAKLTEYPNVPRKRDKFLNFLRNSIGLRDDRSE